MNALYYELERAILIEAGYTAFWIDRPVMVESLGMRRAWAENSLLERARHDIKQRQEIDAGNAKASH